MAIATPEPVCILPPEFPGEAPDELTASLDAADIEGLVHRLAASWQPGRPLFQRRRTHRVLFRRPVRFTPLDSATCRPEGPTVWVQGRDISLEGIRFAHVEPVPNNRAWVEFETPQGHSVVMLVHLIHCRYTRTKLYESGGRFLKLIERREGGLPPR